MSSPTFQLFQPKIGKYPDKSDQAIVFSTPSQLMNFHSLCSGVPDDGLPPLSGTPAGRQSGLNNHTSSKQAAIIVNVRIETSGVGKKAYTERRQYVPKLVDDLETRCTDLTCQFQVHVYQSPAINALALPGGHIIIFTGLLEKVDSENELAFVPAHELGHYAHRDHLRGICRAMVFLTISAVLFGADSGISDMIGTGLNVTEMSFSRKQESWADEIALEALNCSYGHVGGATDFFGRIPAEQDPGEFGHYFASHPQNQQRIDHLMDLTVGRGCAILARKPLAADLKQQKN